MKRVFAIATILALILSACGSNNCPANPQGPDCNAPYGLFCLTWPQYTKAGYNTCADAKSCGLAAIEPATVQCNPLGPSRP